MGEFLKKTLQDFFTITAGILISATVFCYLFIPDMVFGIWFLGQIIAMGFLSTLTNFIFYSRKELTKRQMLVRQLIHICVLLALLLFLIHAWGWIDLGNAAQTAIFVLMVALIYMIVTFLSFQHDKKVAQRLNMGLEKYKRHETE